MTVEVFQLLQVEPRRRLADPGEIEPAYRILPRDDLVVAVTPAEPEQVIVQRFGQDSHVVAIRFDSHRAMPLRQFRAIRSVDQRDVRIDRVRPPALDRVHRADDRQLAERVVQMIVAADDVSHAHVVIVDHDRQHIGRRPVRPEQHEVVQLGVLDGHLALDPIVDRGLAVLRCLQPDDEGAIGIFRSILVAPGAADAQRLLGRLRLCAHRGEFVGGQIAAIGVAVRDHRMRDRRVAVGARELIGRCLVGIEPEPMHPLQDRVDRVLCRSRAVGILDPQQEGAAMIASEKPVEQRGPRAAEVEIPGRRRREAGDDRARRGRTIGGRIGCGQGASDIDDCAQTRVLPD